MPIPPEKPIVFTPCDNLPRVSVAGYRRHLYAGIGLGKDAVERNEDNTVLCAGYPGTGKTLYAQVLARELGFPLLYIKGNSLKRIGNAVEISRQLNGVEKYLTGNPLVVAFDELDLLTPLRDIRPIEDTMITGAMMDILDHRPKKALVLVNANYPLNLDMAVCNRLQYTLFFDLPNAQHLGETLEGLKVPNPQEVGKILYNMAEKTNGRFVIRSVVRACQRVKEREDDPEKMAELLFPHASQIDIGQTDEYMKSNWGYKERSVPVLEYWENVGREYAERKRA